MKKKILGIAVAIVMLFAVLALGGCNNEGGNMNYNAILHHDAGEWMREDFLSANLTRGVFTDGKYHGDDYPNSRIFIVRDSNSFNETFTSFPPEVNFENEMLILYAFTCSHGGWPFQLRNINANEQVLNVRYRMKRVTHGINNASQPWTRWFVIRMDKLDITEVEFSRA